MMSAEKFVARTCSTVTSSPAAGARAAAVSSDMQDPSGQPNAEPSADAATGAEQGALPTRLTGGREAGGEGTKRSGGGRTAGDQPHQGETSALRLTGLGEAEETMLASRHLGAADRAMAAADFRAAVVLCVCCAPLPPPHTQCPHPLTVV